MTDYTCLTLNTKMNHMIYNWDNPQKVLFESPELMVIGIATLLFILLCLILGFRMVYKGFKINYHTLSYIGIIFIGGASLWSGVALNFLTILIFNILPPWELYFLLHGSFIMIALFFGVVGIIDLINLKGKKRKNFLIGLGILMLILEIIYLTALFIDYTILGIPIAPIQVEYQPFSWIYLTTALVIFLSAAGWFVLETFRSEIPQTQLQGKFLLSGGFLFLIGSIGEVYFSNIFVLLISRFIVTIAIFLAYMGFMMPEWVKKAFLKSL